MDKWHETLKLSIPAIVYVIQNNLSFFALSKLDPATYEVTYQIKLLTTAVAMRVMLGKVLNATQWMGLFVLLFGVCLVELEKLTVSEQEKETSANEQKNTEKLADTDDDAESDSSYFSFNVISG